MTSVHLQKILTWIYLRKDLKHDISFWFFFSLIVEKQHLPTKLWAKERWKIIGRGQTVTIVHKIAHSLSFKVQEETLQITVDIQTAYILVRKKLCLFEVKLNKDVSFPWRESLEFRYPSTIFLLMQVGLKKDKEWNKCSWCILKKYKLSSFSVIL